MITNNHLGVGYRLLSPNTGRHLKKNSLSIQSKYPD